MVFDCWDLVQGRLRSTDGCDTEGDERVRLAYGSGMSGDEGKPLVLRLLGLLVLVLLGSACTGLPDSEQGLMDDHGAVTELGVAERDDPVELKAPGLGGESIDLANFRGGPVVVVIWYSTCVPCRAEQPTVNSAVGSLQGTAEFVGLNVRDNSGSALRYEREFGVSYPSIDGRDGQALLAFAGKLTPYSVPAFVVLDNEGRMAARIIGQLPSKLTLTTLVKNVVGT